MNAPSPEVRPHEPMDFGTEVRPRVAMEYGPEVRDPDSVESFVARITSLGATLDEVAAVRAHWDDDWSDEDITRAEMVAMSDADLMAAITAGRDEYRTSTLTEDEEDDQAHRAAVVGYRDEAEHQVTSGSVASVLEWVGDDRDRAAAALLAEQTVPNHGVRVTLVRALEEIVTPVPED